ncbi:uncharacterized protein [Eurosta solidaginis]|uniref:uncharacterized protein n=1 Tax=Eurosta solidaginis TaxID=178769 RepID=UPI0035306918
MHFYSLLILLICCKLATPLFTSRWPHAYRCNLDSIVPRCCIYAREIIPEIQNEVCLIVDKSRGEPHRFSILIDDFPACTVYRSGPCLYKSEICVPLLKKALVCQTSLSLTFKHHAMEWCFSAYLKIYGIKLYKYSRLCTYFAENYFLIPQKIEDILIDAGY